MPIAISYIRFSTGKQSFGRSEKRQREMVARWLTQHPNYQLAPTTYKDLGKSGFSGEHLDRDLGRLLAAINEGLIPSGSMILIEAMDRLGRLEPLDMFSILNQIFSKGISITTLDDGVVYTKESSNQDKLYLLAGKAKQAYDYSVNLSNRIKDVWDDRRAAVKRGDKINLRYPVWINQSDGTLNEEIAPLIVKAFEDAAAGMGNASILKRLKKAHSRFNDFSVAGVDHWFKSRCALGEWNNVKCYPAVVDQELYYLALQTRENNKVKTKTVAREHYLTGLVKCGVCGKNFNHAGQGKRLETQAASFRCENHRRLNCTNNKYAPAVIIEAVRGLTFKPFLEKALTGQILTEKKRELLKVEGEISEAEKVIRRLVKAITLFEEEESKELIEELRQNQRKKKTLVERRAELEQTQEPVSDAELMKEWASRAKELEGKQFDLSHVADLSVKEKKKSKARLRSTLAAEKDLMHLNSLLQMAGYRIIISPSTSEDARLDIEVDGEIYRYKTWIKATKEYILVKPNGTEIPVPSDLDVSGTSFKLLGH